MQTRPEFAAYVEKADFMLDGDSVFVVRDFTDDGDHILIEAVDEDGDVTQFPFAPFDHVTIVESFEDDGSVPEEWEHVYEEGGLYDQR